jgi:hypothetical protein
VLPDETEQQRVVHGRPRRRRGGGVLSVGIAASRAASPNAAGRQVLKLVVCCPLVTLCVLIRIGVIIVIVIIIQVCAVDSMPRGARRGT